MPSETPWTWSAMLDTFRALGGVADNLRPGSMPGAGLHAQDAGRPVSLFVPPNLCFALEDIDFADGEMILKGAANVGPGERKFFEMYCAAFSWGAGGKDAMEGFLASLEDLPADIRRMLENEFGMPDLFAGNLQDRAKERFLWSRRFRWNSRDWFVPIADLVRHGGRGLDATLDAQRRFCIQGTVTGEVLVGRGAYDTLDVYFNFGLVDPQEQAYSFALDVRHGETDLHIGRNTGSSDRRGKFPVPNVTSENGALSFSYLMIGHVKSPRVSRGIFVDLARGRSIANPDEAFDHALFSNRMQLLRLLATLEPHCGEAVVALRRVAHVQLERISHCIGTREL